MTLHDIAIRYASTYEWLASQPSISDDFVMVPIEVLEKLIGEKEPEPVTE